MLKKLREFDPEEYTFTTYSEDIEWLAINAQLGNSDTITGAVYSRTPDGLILDVYFTESTKPWELRAEYLPVGYFTGDCQHDIHEDCMFCCMCGRCRESLDDYDICAECTEEGNNES